VKTRYDVGMDVGIKGRVLSIKITVQGGIQYEVLVNGRVMTFVEDDLSEILDLSDVEDKRG